MMLFICLPLELRPWDPPIAFSPSPKFLMIGGFGAFVVNGWLLDRYLEGRTPGDLRLRPPLRLLRAIACGIPLVGLWLGLASWRSLLARRPGWAFRAKPMPRLQLTAPPLVPGARPVRVRTRRELRWLGVWLPWFWLIGGNFLLLLVTAHGLAVAPLDSGVRSPLRIVSIVVVHGIGLLFFGHYQWRQVKRRASTGWRRTARILLPWTWLLPAPVVLVGFTLAGLLEFEGPRATTLVDMAHLATAELALLAPATETPGFRTWGLEARRSLGDWLRMRTRRHRAKPTREERWWTSARRLKTLLSACDGIALGWLTSRALDLLPYGHPGAKILFLLFGTLLAPFAIAGFVRTILERLPRRFAARQTVRGVGYQTVLVAVTLLAGAALGALLEVGEPRLAGGFLALGAIFYLVGCLLTFNPLVAPSASNRDMGLWAVFFLALLTTGLVMLLDESSARAVARFSRALVVLLPIYHGAFAAAFLGRLLHPFSWGELRGGRYPKPVLRTLRWLAATVSLPFGGLATPWWISVRQRRWPAYRSLWVRLASAWEPVPPAVGGRRTQRARIFSSFDRLDPR